MHIGDRLHNSQYSSDGLLEQRSLLKRESSQTIRCALEASPTNDHQNIVQHLKLLKCTLCQKSFRKKSKLQRHVKETHQNIKDFICNQCGKSFKRKYHLVRHTLSHSNEKALQCSQCVMSFNIKHHLDRHVKLVHNKELFKCSQCTLQFRKKKSLLKHSKSHEVSKNKGHQEHDIKNQDQNNISRVEIGKTKKITKSSRKKRENMLYLCNLCDESFTKHCSLSRHMRKFHKKQENNSLAKVEQTQHTMNHLLAVQDDAKKEQLSCFLGVSSQGGEYSQEQILIEEEHNLFHV